MKKTTSLLVATLTLALLISAGALIACGGDAGPAASTSASDVAAVLTADEQVSRYAGAFQAAGLEAKGPYTVFAASNDAVSAAGVVLDGDMVKASVIEGEDLTRADLEKGAKSDSMLPDNSIVTYTGSDGSLYVNDLKVVGDPISAGNGTVYVVDGVIQPK